GGIHIDDRVATYANLPSPPPAGYTTYLVEADGLIYVWDGSAWPLEGNGVSITGSSKAHHAWRIHITDWWIDPNSTRVYVSLQELLFVIGYPYWPAKPFADSYL